MPLAIATLLVPLFAAGPAIADPPTTGQADYRVVFEYFGVRKAPLSAGATYFRGRRAYHLIRDAGELIVIDFAAKRVEILDLQLKVVAEVPLGELEAKVEAIKADERKAIAELLARPGRADRVEGEIRRHLIDPMLRPSHGEVPNHLRLTNPGVEITASGVPEPDPVRLARLVKVLSILAKLRAYRDPENFLQFTQIDALSILIDAHKLRPTEMTFLFRLSGPPEKYRWVYQYSDEIALREREALDKIDAALPTARRVTLDHFERRLAADRPE